MPCGPSGGLLTATFKHADTLEFQDNVGQAVLHCCRAIPDGVLLFMPSYSMLDKLAGRWKVRACVEEAGGRWGTGWAWRAQRRLCLCLCLRACLPPGGARKRRPRCGQAPPAL